jgi:hypothetical protein
MQQSVLRSPSISRRNGSVGAGENLGRAVKLPVDDNRSYAGATEGKCLWRDNLDETRAVGSGR